MFETKVLTGLPSDHHAIISKVDFARPGPSKKRVVYRKLCAIDLDQFKKDISISLVSVASEDVSALVNNCSV